MTYDIGAEQALETIFSALLIGGIDTPKDGDTPEECERQTQFIREKYKVHERAVAALPQLIPYNIFQDCYAFYYEVLSVSKVKVFKCDMLSTLVDSNRDLILDSPYINIAKYSVTPTGGRTQADELVLGFEADLRDKFFELSNRPVTYLEFTSAVELFKRYYIDNKSLEIAQNCTMILSPDGFSYREPGHRTQLLRGVEDQRNYYAKEILKLKALEENGATGNLIVDDSWLQKELEAEKLGDGDFLCNFGLSALDEVMGGMRKRRMYGILGPPKGGKTRFTNYLVGRLLESGFNVAVWPLEGTPDEWLAVQTSYIMHSQWGINIPSNVVFDRRYSYAEEDGVSADYIRQQITAAKAVLALGADGGNIDKKRGRLSFIDRTAYVEDFLDIIDSHYAEHPFDVLVIDQVVNILSKGRGSKVERIGDAYVRLHNYIQNVRPCCMIGPAQLKQSVIDYMRSHPDETIDVTAGGESAETIRTPDEVIGIMSTKEERNAGIMRLYHVASRHGASFDDVVVRADLGWCGFADDPELNVH